MTSSPSSSKAPSKRRPVVQVVQCAAAFPISNKPKLPPPKTIDQKDTNALDFRETSLEIRRYGVSHCDDKYKRKAYDDEEYERLTGRKRKRIKTPLPILRGMKAKAKQRQEQAAKEAKEAGIVTGIATTKRNKKKERSKEARVHGPAPSVGFVAKGILRVNPKKR